MDRSFPRTRRRSWWTATVLCTVLLACVPTALPMAQADDLRDKQKKAQQDAKAAEHALEHSSKALQAAAKKLRDTRTALGAAQSLLAKTEGELTAARVLDAQMQKALDQAVIDLDRARFELRKGKARVKEQRREIGQMAARNYQFGDPRLMGLSMVLNSQDPTELATQLNTVDSLMNRQAAMYDRLRAAKALLDVQEEQVAAKKQRVAEKRQEAAVNLARKQRLEQQAQENRARVVSLVEDRRLVAAEAARIRAKDAYTLRKMKAEENRIRKLILERARKAKGGYTGSSNGFLNMPVYNSYVTSPFGYRIHPIYGYYGLHNGTDFHAPCGVALHASAGGTVVAQYYDDVYGHRLYLDVGRVNGKNMTLIYNHASSYRVRTGARVARGEVLGSAGTTGWSTACHLHFSVLYGGQFVDPQKFL